MKRKVVLIIGILIVAIAFLMNIDSKDSTEVVYKARLADPALYNTDGLFIDSFSIPAGNYKFRFVPNGDSPRILSINIVADENMLFSEDFELNSIEQGSDLSRYYTWEYNGRKELSIPESKMITITINPHGNLIGPVTVELIKL